MPKGVYARKPKQVKSAKKDPPQSAPEDGAAPAAPRRGRPRRVKGETKFYAAPSSLTFELGGRMLQVSVFDDGAVTMTVDPKV